MLIFKEMRFFSTFNWLVHFLPLDNNTARSGFDIKVMTTTIITFSSRLVCPKKKVFVPKLLLGYVRSTVVKMRMTTNHSFSNIECLLFSRKLCKNRRNEKLFFLSSIPSTS